MAPATPPPSLPALLGSLTQSLTSSFDVTPKLAGIDLSKDGLSLLDVKNELLLSYLQNLVFLILLKLRNAKQLRQRGSAEAQESSPDVGDAVVKKLVELRLYLEKGVRPLEDKLRYQIEKVLRAVDDTERHERAAADAAKLNGGVNGTKVKGGHARARADDSDESESEAAGDESSSESGDEGEDEDADVPTAKLSELQFRPNPSAFVRPADADSGSGSKGKGGASRDGIYRPPKIAPTSMPTTERRDKAERQRPIKSATMDEFITDELSVAPLSQPSIGTNIQGRGRHVKTAAERKEEDERRAYEETNFIRLPKEGKKERARKAQELGGGARSGRMTFGGEEWRDLGEGVDRINKLTRGKDGGGRGASTRALLDKSRKRGLDTVDGPRGSGAGAGVAEMGERYKKRLKVVEMGRTSRGKNR